MTPDIPIGSTWALIQNDPWPAKDLDTAKIIDRKNRWVRYYLNSTFPDNRMQESMFLMVYRRIK